MFYSQIWGGKLKVVKCFFIFIIIFPVIRLVVIYENKDKPGDLALSYTDKQEIYFFFLDAAAGAALWLY